jgi:site-specific DNA-cytosine methylase
MYGTIEEMRVLSLFDGISCGRVALERAGIPVEAYYAAEIDQHAIRVSQANWPDIIHIGDVSKVKGVDLGEIDLILAGSPCQGFSNNGVGLGFEDPRSRLFWQFVRLVEECKPTWFLLENVRMKKEWADIISGAVGCEPIVLNSALVSAQRRLRYYWTNIPYSGPPADRGLVLKDILEGPIAPDQPMTDRGGRAYSLTATYGNCGKPETGEPYLSEILHNTERHQRTCVLVGRAGITTYLNDDRVYSADAKSPCITTSHHAPKITDVKVVGKSKADGYNGQGNRVYGADGKMATLGTGAPKVQTGGSAAGADVPHIDKPVIRREDWRMLSCVECERLQTLPDGYTAAVSKTQRYKALGNGWTVDMVVHLLRGMG